MTEVWRLKLAQVSLPGLAGVPWWCLFKFRLTSCIEFMRSQADLHYTWHHQILEITGYSHVTASLSHTHTPLPYLASTLPSWPILTTALYSHLESISSLTQASSTNSSADSLGLLTSSHRKSNHINSTSRQHHAMASFRVQSGGDERLVIRFGHRIITVEWNQQARFKKKKTSNCSSSDSDSIVTLWGMIFSQ